MEDRPADDIEGLSPQARLALIGKLWDSLADTDIPLTPAQVAELERRFDSFDSDRAHGVTWEQLKAELLHRHS